MTSMVVNMAHVQAMDTIGSMLRLHVNGREVRLGPFEDQRTLDEVSNAVAEWMLEAQHSLTIVRFYEKSDGQLIWDINGITVHASPPQNTVELDEKKEKEEEDDSSDLIIILSMVTILLSVLFAVLYSKQLNYRAWP